jgi:hypothetical protein
LIKAQRVRIRPHPNPLPEGEGTRKDVQKAGAAILVAGMPSHHIRMLFPFVLFFCQTVLAEPELVSVRKISDQAKHSAFTDLIYFKDRWICTFREGAGHVSPDGSIAVLESADCEKWTRAAHLTSDKGDLRDPKISIMPDGRLLLTAAMAIPMADKKKEHRTYVWLSEDGRKWSEAKEVGDVNVWLWRIAWHKSKAYGVGYATAGEDFARLYQSDDGTSFKTVVPSLFAGGGDPSEAALVFLEDDTMLCLLRRDQKGADSGVLGESRPPYTQWTWKDLGTKIGGPAMIRLPDKRLLSVVRLYQPNVHTAVCWVDQASGKITPFLKLPSGGDTSYAGLVYREGLLRVSYYSSHEGKTSIYLATVRVP